MIASLTGRVAAKNHGVVVIDGQVVTYAVRMPLSTFYRLHDPEHSVSLKIHTHVDSKTARVLGVGQAVKRAEGDKNIVPDALHVNHDPPGVFGGEAAGQ